MQPPSRRSRKYVNRPMPAEATKQNKMPVSALQRSRRQLAILLVSDSTYPLERLRVPFTRKQLIKGSLASNGTRDLSSYPAPAAFD